MAVKFSDDYREMVIELIRLSEVGTNGDYVAECGKSPLSEFVREIIGFDMMR